VLNADERLSNEEQIGIDDDGIDDDDETKDSGRVTIGFGRDGENVSEILQ